ncbi:BON domain-containing protein [Gammaproteobacteria bacterium]|nr:BON domain-containing protein [Gammaproteobacteria bacterium]
MIMKTASFFSLLLISSFLTSCVSDKSVDDSRNEKLSLKKIMDSYPSDLSKANINISSFNGDLLITGQVPRQELIDLATNQANTLRNVREVFNYLQVMGQTSFLSKANDLLITNRVKSGLQDLKFVKIDKIHIVTEHGMVYLMGTLNPKELKIVLEMIEETKGVQKAISLARLD